MGLTQNLGRLSPSIFSDASLNIGVGAAPSGSYKFEVTGTSKVSGVLTLGSTLSNGTYTYTLPSATGTLALTSDIPSLTGYVTLATTQTISGDKTFSSAVNITGANLGHAANKTVLSQEGASNGAFWQSYGTNTSTLGKFSLRQYSSDASIGSISLSIDASGNSTFGGTVTSTALTVATSLIGIGRVVLNSGDATHSGYINWYNGSISRLGYMGYNNTDIELTLEGTSTFKVTGGAATFSSSISAGTTITAQSGYFAQDVVGDPVYLRVRNLNTGGYSSAMALSLYGYGGTAAYYDVLTIRASYPGYGKVDFFVKGQSTSTSINALSIDATNGAAIFSSSVTATIFDSTSNAFRFNGSNALSLVTLNSQNVVKINAAGYWGTQLVGANDQGILINNIGYVGLGNTDPQARLHIGVALANSADATNGFILKQTGTNETTGIYIERSGERKGYAIYVGGSLDSLVFQRNNAGTKSDVMTMTRDGNVGIGTGSPQLKLDIQNGSLGIYHSTSGSNGAQIYLGDMNFAGGAYATSAPGIGSAYNSSQAVAGDLAFYIYASTASSRNEAMRIKGGTGNVGIGQTNATILLDLKRETAPAYGSLVTLINLNGYFPGYDVDAQRAGIAAGVPDLGNTTFGWMGFQTRGSDGYNTRMVVSGNGNVGIGTLNPTSTAYPANGRLVVFGDESQPNLVLSTAGSSSFGVMRFVNANGIAGSISMYPTSVSYNTSSDYRLKQDLKDFKGLDLISAIKTYDYEWKADNKRAYGVLAHELQEVLPQAVFGEKDGKEMQGVDYSKIVPILVKAIQELTQKVNTLNN